MATSIDFSTTRSEIAGVSIRDIVNQFGTPTYVYDSSFIKQRIEDLKSFDVIRYAQKANSNLAIVDLARRSGAFVDAVSAGEIFRAMKAGFEPGQHPPQIVYTADIFDHVALDTVCELGIHCNLGSPDMIDQLGERKPGSEVTLRINPGFGHGHSQKTNTGGESSKHGIWHTQIGECLERCKPYNISVTGLHMHIGSGTDFEHLSEVCGAMEKAVDEVGSSITSISAGGGLPIAYKEGESQIDIARYFNLWDETRNRISEKLGHRVNLEIEPGRYVSAEAGYLIAEIRAIKTMGSKTFYVCDAGFNNLARPILYGAYHPMSICAGDGRELTETSNVVVGGPLCESGDIFTQDSEGFVDTRELPAAQIGDFVVIERAGAYGYVMSSNYNSKPFAAEVLVEDGNFRQIRKRQSFDDLIAGESI